MNAIVRTYRRDPMDNIDLATEYECPAIKRCSEAWYQAWKKHEATGINPVSVRLRANEAYRYAMPPLNSAENISDFVACVVHGMMVGSIIDELGTRWLYAAQVAAATFNAKQKALKSKKQKAAKLTSSRKNSNPPPSPTVKL